MSFQLLFDRESNADRPSDTAVRTIAFIDPALDDYQTLIEGVDSEVEISVLDPNQDGFEQITQTLAQRSDVTAVHIFSHGSPGHLYLGNAQLNAETLSNGYPNAPAWSTATAAIDLFLYGCRVAEGTVGTAFLKKLHSLSGANIAASTTRTGHADLGGDWDLDVQVGEISASSILRADAMRNYAGVMATVLVSNTADSGAGSLRAAIANAQSGDTIAFAAGLAGQTITLTSGQLSPTANNLTIDGAGAAGLTISGNNASRIFSVGPSTGFVVKNMTLANGSATDGGAINAAFQAAVVVDNVTFSNNTAVNNGGAIATAFSGSLTVTNSRFNSNVATAGNSEQGAGAIFFFGPGALTVQNSDFNNNRGINGGAINSLNGTILVENSRFIGNDVSAGRVAAPGTNNASLRGYGGAIYTDRANDTTTIRGSVFENNTSLAAGGALYLFNDSEDVVTIENSGFKSNKALGLPGGEGGSGGAIYQLRNSSGSGSFTATNVSFVDNESHTAGGAIRLTNSPSTISNATFFNNRIVSTGQDFSANGGALVAFGSTVNLSNSTLSQNTAYWVGGGVAASSDSTINVRNSIFNGNVSLIGGTTPSGNEPFIGKDNLIDQGGNIQFPTIGGSPGSGVRVVDPLLGTLQQSGNLYFLPPQAGSPALTAGVGGTAIGASSSGPLTPILPTLGIGNVSLLEGNSGTTDAVFTVSLSSTSTTPISVNFATADGTAIAGSDYTALSGTLNFAPNQLSQTIRIPVIGDTVNEANETFSVNLSGPTNATVLTARGTATILNDDGTTPGTTPPGTTPPSTTPPGTTPPGTTPPGTNPPDSGPAQPPVKQPPVINPPATFSPSLSINDVQVLEGSRKGVTKAVFTVSLSEPVSRRVSVDYSTANGSALAGSDYRGASGRVSFRAGETTKTIQVTIYRDRLVEPDETFSVNLGQSVNASVSKGQGIGTIVNDDFVGTSFNPATLVSAASTAIQSVLNGNLPAAAAALSPVNSAAGGFFTKGLAQELAKLNSTLASTDLSSLSAASLTKGALAALRK